ncbi:ABC transporter ATP-binding protein, partial [Ornithobacterium rhinotracheale]
MSLNEVQIARKIGYLPENYPLFYEMYFREYLTFVANIRNLSPQKVDDVVERVGLTAEQNKKI